MKKKNSKLSFETSNIILAAGLIMILLVVGIKFNQFQQLPGPAFGGDIYRNNGMILNILEKGHPFSSSYFNDASAYYSWLPFILVAFLTVLGIPLLKAHTLWLPLIEITISLFIFYYCSKYFLKDKKLSAAAALFMTSMSSISYSSYLIMNSLLLLFLTHFFKVFKEKKQNKSDIYAGITLGIISLVRFSEFFVMVIISGLFIMANFLYKKDYSKKNFFAYIKKYWKIYAFGFGISLLMIIPILIQHHFVAKNPVYQYGENSLSVRGFSWMFKVLQNSIFSINSFKGFFFSFMTLLGFISILITKNKKEFKPLIFFFFVPIILTIHHYITKPLFNKWFLPNKFLIYGYLVPLMIVFGIIFVLLLLSKIDSLKIIKKYSNLISIIIVLLLFAITFNSRIDSIENDRWYQYGLQNDPQIEAYYRLGDWLKNNVGEDEVILAGDETSFMINGVSGKKVVSSRRTHVSYYVDVDQRIADTAIIFYGNNNQLREELLEKYNIKFLYYDFYFQSQPMRVLADKKEYLESNGVIFQAMKERLDIAIADAEVFDLLIIPPQNVSQSLTSKLSPEIEVKVGEQQLGVLFRVN